MSLSALTQEQVEKVMRYGRCRCGAPREPETVATTDNNGMVVVETRLTCEQGHTQL